MSTFIFSYFLKHNQSHWKTIIEQGHHLLFSLTFWPTVFSFFKGTVEYFRIGFISSFWWMFTTKMLLLKWIKKSPKHRQWIIKQNTFATYINISYIHWNLSHEFFWAHFYVQLMAKILNFKLSFSNSFFQNPPSHLL